MNLNIHEPFPRGLEEIHGFPGIFYSDILITMRSPSRITEPCRGHDGICFASVSAVFH